MTENEALKTLEDLQRLLTNYRHISTELTEANGIAIQALEENQQYHAIGTVEECRAAMEKQSAKTLTFYGDSEDGKLLCPACKEDLWEIKECGFSNCPYCGQKLNWG